MHILLVEGMGVRVVREVRSRCLCIYRGRLGTGTEDFEFAIDYFKPKPTKPIPTIITTTITNIIKYILIIHHLIMTGLHVWCGLGGVRGRHHHQGG